MMTGSRWEAWLEGVIEMRLRHVRQTDAAREVLDRSGITGEDRRLFLDAVGALQEAEREARRVGEPGGWWRRVWRRMV